MTEQSKRTARLGFAVAATALLVAGCTTGSGAKAPVEHRGTDPSSTATTAPPPSTGGSGIVTNGTDRYLVAEKGDTVATLAARHGFSASELAGYNGLTPDTTLFVGQDLVVPPGAVSSGSAVAGAGGGFPATGGVTDGTVEARPLPGAGGTDGTIPGDGGTGVATDGTTPGTTGGGVPRWSPELAADAIARSGDGTATGGTGLKEDGRLGAPPSSTKPVPEAPGEARNLKSPGLDQYQTKASDDAAARTGPPPPADVAAVDTNRTADTGRKVKLQRPVSGPIAVGFGEGAGPAKNDGVDFAAPAGAPVVAADDGEVALVSETLGGLGTIVLVRHKEELLTVYGRVDKVGVKKGDIVRRGQKIGVVAGAETPDKSRMHFEVRRGATVLDPMGFL